MKKTILIIFLTFSFSTTKAYQLNFYKKFSIVSLSITSASFLLDDTVKKTLNKNKNQTLNEFTSFFNQFGTPYMVSLPIFGYLLSKVKKDKKFEKLSRQAIFASVLAGSTSFFIKEISKRKRPDKSDKKSFPSGHTALSTAIFLTYSKAYDDYRKYIFYSIPLFVGFSRIYKNKHYFSDVIAGYFLGYLSVFLSEKFDRYFVKNIKSFVYYDFATKNYTLKLNYSF